MNYVFKNITRRKRYRIKIINKKSMSTKLKEVLIYGLGVFAVYAILTYLLRVFFNRAAVDAEFFGIYSKNDLFVGVLVAVVLTFSHQRKKNIK